MVCALGAGDRLVGRSHECDFPPEISQLPACTAPRIDVNATGGAIDQQVKSLPSGESLYRLDTSLLQSLKPDLILTQAQCAVCAVNLAEVEQLVRQWPGSPPKILALSPARLTDIWDDLRRVSEALGLAEHGREVLRGLKSRVVNIIEKTCVLKQHPSVVCIEWLDPLMAAGNWVPELVELAGGANLAGQAGAHSPWMKWGDLTRLDPDRLMMIPCGFDLVRTRKEMSALSAHPAWSNLRAVKNNCVFLADGSHFFNRPGPRIVESLEILAEILHPDRFNFGYKGKAWEKFSSGAAQ